MSTYQRNERASSSPQVLMGLSGGVASAVTAALLNNQGYEIHGLRIKVSKGPEKKCALTQAPSIKLEKLCKSIGIRFHEIDISDEYQEAIVDNFVHDRISGREGYPCHRCSEDLVFQHLFRKADELGIEKVSTGHFAQITVDPDPKGGVHVSRAVDLEVDESHLLFDVPTSWLRRLLLPMGTIPRKYVTRLIAELGVLEGEQIPSLELRQRSCFWEGFDSDALIEASTAPVFRLQGPIRSGDGFVVGDHEGLFRYRVGEPARIRTSAKEFEKHVVTGFDPVHNVLVVGSTHESFQHQYLLDRVNWIQSIEPFKSFRATARRLKIKENLPCWVTAFENNAARVEFDERIPGVGVGSALVLYRGDEVLGGGFVESWNTPKTVEK